MFSYFQKLEEDGYEASLDFDEKTEVSFVNSCFNSFRQS